MTTAPAPHTCTCRVCGRRLRDAVSVATGVGPRCADVVTARHREPQMFRAEYFAEEVDGVLVLFDRDAGSMSLTNDAERVLLEEWRRRSAAGVEPPLPDVVIYRDSTGRYDRLLHRRGAFGGFAPLGATSLTEAVRLAKGRDAA